jgi:hypothetical protein
MLCLEVVGPGGSLSMLLLLRHSGEMPVGELLAGGNGTGGRRFRWMTAALIFQLDTLRCGVAKTLSYCTWFKLFYLFIHIRPLLLVFIVSFYYFKLCVVFLSTVALSISHNCPFQIFFLSFFWNCQPVFLMNG